MEDEDDMGASFGPVQLEQDSTSLCIPPVQAGAADPRQVWLNVGCDSGDQYVGVRIWGSNGDGAWFPVNANGSADGMHAVKSGVALSISLPKGLRILSITRKPVIGDKAVEPAPGGLGPKPFAGSISVCFERQ